MFKKKMKQVMRKTITLLFIYHQEMSVTTSFQAVIRKTLKYRLLQGLDVLKENFTWIVIPGKWPAMALNMEEVLYERKN